MTVVQACRWAGVSRRSYYYRPTKAKPRVNEHLAARVKRVITDLHERWPTDIARVWCGPVHRWCALTIVMGCHTRDAFGWRRLSHNGNAKAAEAVLEEALII